MPAGSFSAQAQATLDFSVRPLRRRLDGNDWGLATLCRMNINEDFRMKAISFLALLTVSSVVSAGALVPNKTVDIALDGYCDGLHLVINQAAGTVSGNRIGCRSAPLTGYVGSNSKSGAGVVISTTDEGTGNFVFIVEDAPKTWSVTVPDGSFSNSGAYSIGVPALAPQAGTRASTD